MCLLWLISLSEGLAQWFINDTSIEVVRINRHWRRHLVQGGEILRTNFQVGGAQVFLELREFIRPQKNRADEWLAQNPGQGDLGNRRIVGLADRSKPIDNLMALLPVVGQHVERIQSSAVTLRIL